MLPVASCFPRWQAILAAALATVAISTGAQPYGLNSRGNIGTYLGGTMPATDPGNGMHTGIPTTLSGTGAFSNVTTLAPHAGLVPFGLNTPLWSDGALKDRWIALAYNSGSMTNPTVGFAPTGEWTFPNGTVFVKHFELVINEATLAKRRLETRILVRSDNGLIYGRTYKWRLDNTEADLLTTGQNEDITITNPDGMTTRIQTYTYPSPAQCKQCHTVASGGVLGAKTRQQNGTFTYTAALAAGGTGVTDNQLRTWNHLGMFDTTLIESNISGYDKLAALGDASATLEKRARSYIDSNCSYCHRPDGPPGAAGVYDGRYDTPILSQNIAGSATTNSGAKLWRHNLTDQSRILWRDNLTTPQGGMPPVDKNVVDEDWIDSLSAWITYAFDLVSTNVPGAGNNKVRAVFNSNLDPASATTLSNYAFDPVLAVAAAVLESDRRTVTLTTGAMTPGQNYKLTVNRVQEAAAPGNPVWPNSNHSFMNVAPGVTLSIESASYSVNEVGGSITIGVTRVGGSGAVSVGYGTLDGTALAGSDYTATTGTLNWANGDTATKFFVVPILNGPIAEHDEVFHVFLGTPTGGAVIGDRLSAMVTIRETRPFDLSADGKSDLLLRHTDGSIYLWIMDTYPVSGAFLATDTNGWSVTHVADFDSDGRSDIVMKHTDGSVKVIKMDGSTVVSGALLLGAGTPWTVTHTGDVNGDGRSDLILRNTDGSVYVWTMNGVPIGGGFLGTDTNGWLVTHVADFNGDGKADIVMKHTDGSVKSLQMDGAAITAGYLLLGTGTPWTLTHTGDVTGDGRADMVLRHTDGSVYIWVMNGAPTGGNFLGTDTNGWVVTHMADFNGDLRSDIVMKHTDGSVKSLLMDGPSIITGYLLLGSGTPWAVTHTLDTTGDGRAEILLRHTDQSMYIWVVEGLPIGGAYLLLGANPWTIVPPMP